MYGQNYNFMTLKLIDEDVERVCVERVERVVD